MALAFVFPGQGSQSVGMLAELGAAEPAVRDCLLELARGLGIAEVRDLLHVVGTPAPDQQ